MPEVIVSYNTRDFIDAHKLAARGAWNDRRRWLFLALGSILGIGVLTIAADPQNRSRMLATAAVIMPIGTVAGYWLSQRASIAINGRRALKAHPFMREDFTYEVQPGCLLQRSKHGNTIVRWNELKAFSEDNNSWLLYPDFQPGQSYLLPKRCLTPKFEAALGNHLQAAGVPRR